MTAPSRRAVLGAIGGAFLGVIAYSRQPHWPGFFGGVVRVTPLEPLIDRSEHDAPLPPSEYVTPHDDDRLVDLAPLQEVLRETGEQQYFERELSRREYGRAFAALEELPEFAPHRYEGYGHPVRRGIYVENSAYTYRVQLTPWCSDAWWIESRGTPTIGGLGCRER